MGHGVIDGERWIRERLAFLRDLLKTELGDDQRKAVEEEISRLSSERGIRSGGRRRWWWLPRWPFSSRSSRPDAGKPGEAGGGATADQAQPSSSNRASDMPK